MNGSARSQTAPAAALRQYGLPVVGLATFRLAAWAQLSGVLAAAGSEFVAASHIVQLLAMVLVLAADRFAVYSANQVLRAAGIATACTLAGVAVYILGPAGETTLLLGGAITGAVSSVVVLAWGYYLCSVDPRHSAVGIAGGFALYGLLTLVCAELPSGALAAIALAGPLMSFGCLWAGFSSLTPQPVRESEEKPADSAGAAVSGVGGSFARTEAPGPQEGGRFTRDTLAMFAVLGACTLVNLLGKLLIPLDEEPHALLHRLLWPLLFVALFAVVALWVLGLKREPEGLWPLFVLVMVSGLVGYPSFMAVDPAFASAYLRASQDCLMLFCWLVVAALAFRHGYRRLPFFGWTTVAFVKPPLIVSAVLLMAFSSTLAHQDQAFVLIATGGAAFLLVAVVVVLAGLGMPGRQRGSEQVPAGPGADGSGGYLSSLERAAAELQGTYGLTARETDVAMLMARGNTMAQTAAELNVSLDTVRAHSKSLYRRLDIHKKQELVALVDGLLREGEG